MLQIDFLLWWLEIYLTKVSIKQHNKLPKTTQISVKQHDVRPKRGEYDVSNAQINIT